MYLNMLSIRLIKWEINSKITMDDFRDSNRVVRTSINMEFSVFTLQYGDVSRSRSEEGQQGCDPCADWGWVGVVDRL